MEITLFLMSGIPKKKQDKSLLLSAFLFAALLITGTLGFSAIEKYSITEAFYMTVITVFTVGFGEIHQLSLPGMYFTIFLIILSFGIFGYVITVFTRYIVDGGIKRIFI